MLTGALEQKAAANRQLIAAIRLRLAAGEQVARLYQTPGLAQPIDCRLAKPDRAGASFPIETPDCPTDPADERAAEQATTTRAPRR